MSKRQKLEDNSPPKTKREKDKEKDNVAWSICEKDIAEPCVN